MDVGKPVRFRRSPAAVILAFEKTTFWQDIRHCLDFKREGRQKAGESEDLLYYSPRGRAKI